ncbi:capsid protein [Streptomyces sp. AC495_CC817]|uniref:capsid protein n=1 Tax=Streptomyces sp. AC495_CC817 TaxID=2823900 RepID=UPI001C2761EC|nr:capsid protein [Streptomyces sp. AC495_CC817]
MPIPEQNTPWLPAPWDGAYKAFAENDAWFTGDVTALEKLYQREGARATHYRHGQAMQGGVAGVASRFFWGRPVPTGENRARLHVPAPADLATLASDLVFAEPPEVKLEKSLRATVKAQDRLDLIANGDEAHATFNQMGELKSALGAVALVVRWDTAVADHAWLEPSAADVIIPTFRSGRLVECTLWSEYVKGSVYYRHLEHHAIGMIEHALYAGSENNLGRRVPLTEIPETATYAEIVNSDSRILTNIDRLTVVYNKNIPTAAWRKKGVLANTGRSDFAQLHGLFDWLDETFSSWMRDLRLGAGRILVPEAALDFNGLGQGSSFDSGREIFAGLNIPGKPGEVAFDKVQFEIRTEAHEKTAFAIYREILRKAGFSQSAWGDYTGVTGQMTATEVSDREKASERTRDKKILQERVAIGRAASVALEIDGLVFPGKGGGRFEQPTVVFPDVSQEDPEKLARTLTLLDTAAAISLEQKVRRANPDWEDQQILDEVKAIRAERPAVPDPAGFTGDPVDDEV